MGPSRWLLGMLCMAWMGSGAEADLLLSWEFPQTLGPQAWFLTLVAITTETPTLATRTLEPLDEANCRRQLGPAYVEGQSWCAQLACLPSGAYQLLLQADEGSSPSEPLAVGIQTPPCTPVEFEEALARAVPVRLPPPLPLAHPTAAPPALSTPEMPPPRAPTTSAPGTPTPAPGRSQAPPRHSHPVAPAPALFEAVGVPASGETEGLTSDRFVQAFAELARRYDAAMDLLVEEYNQGYDNVLAHPSPAGQRRLEDLYQRTTQRQQQIYDEATQAWERLYAAWQQFMLTPALASPRTEDLP